MVLLQSRGLETRQLLHLFVAMENGKSLYSNVPFDTSSESSVCDSSGGDVRTPGAYSTRHARKRSLSSSVSAKEADPKSPRTTSKGCGEGRKSKAQSSNNASSEEAKSSETSLKTTSAEISSYSASSQQREEGEVVRQMQSISIKSVTVHENSSSSKSSDASKEDDIKKGAGKQKRVTASASSYAPPAESSSSEAASASSSSVEGQLSLMQLLQTEKEVRSVVDQWIARYKRDKTAAMLDLGQLFFDVAGLKGELTREHLEKGDDDGYASLLETFAKGKSAEKDPPIVYKRQQVLLAVFLQLLVQKCDSLLFDEYLLESLISLLVPMSSQKLRVYRLVGTLSVLKCMTPLLNVRMVMKEQLAMARRQLQTEEAKDATTRAFDRVESLTNRIRALETNEKDLCALLKYTVKVVLKERVLDVWEDIQVLCLNELCLWMEMEKETFMVGRFLAYYKLLLRIRHVTVRSACLKSMLILYEKGTYLLEMREFTHKVIPDYATMTLDISLDVSVLAFKNLECILKLYGTDILSGHTNDLFSLVFSPHGKVAKAAGSFLIAWMEYHHSQSAGRERTPKTVFLNLVDFLEEAQLPEHAPFLVDALLPSCDTLQLWDEAVSLFSNGLSDSGTDGDDSEEELTFVQETNLLKLVSASVRQLCSGVSPREEKSSALGAKAAAKALAQQKKQRLEVTKAFLPEMPQLLLKFRSDADQVVLLLAIADHFLLQHVTPGTQHSLVHLARALGLLLEVHADKAVVGGCCRVMACLGAQASSPTAPFVVEWVAAQDKHYCGFMKTLDDVGACFRRDANPGADLVFALGTHLRRLVVLHEHRDLGTDRMWNVTLNYVIRAPNLSAIPRDVLEDLIKLCHLSLIHSWKSLEKNHKERAEVSSLKSKALQFLYVLQELLRICDRESMLLVFVVLCDVLYLFGEEVDQSDSESVHVPLTSTLHESLRGYLEGNVFQEVQESEGRNARFRSRALRAYIKLLQNNILKFEYVSWIVEFCGDVYQELHDVLKEAVTEMLSRYENETVLAVGKSLKACSAMPPPPHGQLKRAGIERKTVTRKYSLIFSCFLEFPEALAKLHVLCIRFGFETDKYILFDILSELVGDISQENCLHILEILREYEENPNFKKVSTYKAAVSRKYRILTTPRRSGRKIPALK